MDIRHKGSSKDGIAAAKIELGQIISSLPVGIFIVDANEEVVYANRAAERLFGKKMSSAESFRCGDFISCANSSKNPSGCGYSEDCPACPLSKAIRSILADSTGIAVAGNTELHRDKDSNRMWIKYHARKIEFFNQGFVVITTEDITDEKIKEAALKESEERFRSLANSGYALVWTSGPDMECDYFNEPWLRFTGRTVAQELGSGWLENVHPDDRESCMETYTQAFRKREKFSMIYRIRRYDGDYRWVEDFGSPRVDNKDNFIGYIGHCLDITDRKIAEEALRESEKRFRDLSEMLPETVFEADIDMNLTYVNRHAFTMFGYSETDFNKGLNGFDMIVPEDRKTASENALKRLQREQIGMHEYRGLRKDGSTFPALFQTTPILNKGDVVGLRGIIVDITERKKIEEQLLRAQRMESIGNLAGGIAHDFNNILFPIVGMSEMLLEDLPTGSPERENAEEIYRAGKRGSDLVKQILAFSRQSEHKKIPVRVQQVLKEVLGLCRATIPSDIDITIDIQKDCGLVMADPTQLHQIAMNLIMNAYHAVEETGGGISVRLKETHLAKSALAGALLPPGTYAWMTVSDTGCGIDPAIINRVFEPYFTTKAHGKGTGLGLSVVYGIVRECGGDIQVQSEFGKGASFSVYLPLMERTADPATPEEGTPYLTGTERVLLVDDEEPIARLEMQMLERLGYQVAYRLSSAEALAAFKANPNGYDLVLTDMAMPHMTGMQLAEKLVAVRPDIPIIICTGFSERIGREKAEAIGVKGFLMKPVVKSDMARMVRNVLDAANG